MRLAWGRISTHQHKPHLRPLIHHTTRGVEELSNAFGRNQPTDQADRQAVRISRNAAKGRCCAIGRGRKPLEVHPIEHRLNAMRRDAGLDIGLPRRLGDRQELSHERHPDPFPPCECARRPQAADARPSREGGCRDRGDLGVDLVVVVNEARAPRTDQPDELPQPAARGQRHGLHAECLDAPDVHPVGVIRHEGLIPRAVKPADHVEEAGGRPAVSRA